MADHYVSGTAQFNVRFDIYGEVANLLAPYGLSVSDIVWRAFIEASNLGNRFEVAHQTFTIDTGRRSFRLALSSYVRETDQEICICVSRAGNEDAELHEGQDALLEDCFADQTGHPTRH